VFDDGRNDDTNQPGKSLFLLILFYLFVSSISLYFVGRYYGTRLLHWHTASPILVFLATAPFAALSILFAVRPFSFGYAAGFFLYASLLGYASQLPFSTYQYNHLSAYISAFLCGVALLLPALFFVSPIRPKYVLPLHAFDRLLSFILISSVCLIAIGASFNFQFVSISSVGENRNHIEIPVWYSYSLNITSTALLPFAFACFVLMKKPWKAGFSLALIFLFFPISLSKLQLFAPVFLLFLALASRFVSDRAAIVFSLLVPMLLGILLAALHETSLLSYTRLISYFDIANFRMIAVPSIALDVYNDFFSRHDLTLFCQINVIKRLAACPYHEPLAALMSSYNLGNFNASLLATEGIASVGPAFAPLSVFACGLVIALGNRLSSGLPPRFVLVSSGMLLQVLMNVPLTISMVTYGGTVLFLLWYLTPRKLFEPSGRDN
jgi:hypothetical protein